MTVNYYKIYNDRKNSKILKKYYKKHFLLGYSKFFTMNPFYNGENLQNIFQKSQGFENTITV